MFLYLVRHGKAAAEGEDRSRPLTAKGIEEVTQVTQLLKKNPVKVTAIFHSGKKRAEETAEIIKEQLTLNCPLLIKKYFSPNDSTDFLYQEISHIKEDIMMVGHMPFLGKLASRLITGTEEPVVFVFNTAAVLLIERLSDMNWQVMFHITPEFL